MFLYKCIMCFKACFCKSLRKCWQDTRFYTRFLQTLALTGFKTEFILSISVALLCFSIRALNFLLTPGQGQRALLEKASRSRVAQPGQDYPVSDFSHWPV